MSINTAASTLKAAFAFARRGWPVFPCSPQNKRPLLARDKDAAGQPIKGSGGVSKATLNEDQIRAWWAKWPDATIGIAVGRGGLLVVDFDPRREETADPDTGEVSVTEWTLDQLKADLEAQMGCSLPPTLAARTPSGGVHLYFQMPDGEPIGNRGNLPRHVDVRGMGGYVIAPPSIGDAGAYRWLRGDADAPIAAMPAPLVRILRDKPVALHRQRVDRERGRRCRIALPSMSTKRIAAMRCGRWTKNCPNWDGRRKVAGAGAGGMPASITPRSSSAGSSWQVRCASR